MNRAFPRKRPRRWKRGSSTKWCLSVCTTKAFPCVKKLPPAYGWNGSHCGVGSSGEEWGGIFANTPNGFSGPWSASSGKNPGGSTVIACPLCPWASRPKNSSASRCSMTLMSWRRRWRRSPGGKGRGLKRLSAASSPERTPFSWWGRPLRTGTHEPTRSLVRQWCATFPGVLPGFEKKLLICEDGLRCLQTVRCSSFWGVWGPIGASKKY